MATSGPVSVSTGLVITLAESPHVFRIGAQIWWSAFNATNKASASKRIVQRVFLRTATVAPAPTVRFKSLAKHLRPRLPRTAGNLSKKLLLPGV